MADYAKDVLVETQWVEEHLGDDTIRVCPTCIRVPVDNCHSESILVETERKLTAAEARQILSDAPGILVVDNLDQKQYPMPRTCAGRARHARSPIRRGRRSMP